MVAAGAFFAFVLPRWPHGPLLWTQDADYVLAAALESLRLRNPFLWGHPVPPTRLFLGPLFQDTWALWLTLLGPDPWRAWVAFLTLDLVGILAAVPLLRPTLGRLGAWIVVAVLIGDPQFGDEQMRPFWYQFHALPYLVPALAGLVGFAAGRGRAWWWLALAGAGLASQIHAFLWALLPVVVGVTVVRARSLRPVDLGVGAVIVALTAWPLLLQVPVLLDPGTWTATFAGDGPARVEVARRFAEHAARRIAGGTVVVPLAVVAGGLRVVAGPSQGAWRAATAVALAWLASLLVLTVAVGPRWTLAYHWSTILPLAVLVAHLVDAAARRLARPGLVGAATAAALLAHGRPLADREQPPRPAVAWQAEAVIARAAEALVAQGVTTADLDGGRVHGAPCSARDPVVCPASSWPFRLPDAPSALPVDEDVLVRIDDGAPRVQRVARCATAAIAGGVLTARRTCGDGALQVALLLPRADADRLDARPEVTATARYPTGDLPPEATVLGVWVLPAPTTIPVGTARLHDAWTVAPPLTPADLGLSPLP